MLNISLMLIVTMMGFKWKTDRKVNSLSISSQYTSWESVWTKDQLKKGLWSILAKEIDRSK